MIVFWLATALLSVAVAVLIVLRAARAADLPPAEDPSLAVYRRQLSEIDDLADRGLLVQTERRSARTEAARRLLAAPPRCGPSVVRSEPAGRGRRGRQSRSAGADRPPATDPRRGADPPRARRAGR